MTVPSLPGSFGCADWFARLGGQALLVPEALILVLLLSGYYASGSSVILSGLALFVALWFGLRMSLLIQARRAFAQGRIATAIALAQWAVSLCPVSADALALMGIARLADGQIDDAVRYLQRARAYYPWQPGVHTALATAWLEADAPQAAREAARFALHLDPTYGPAYVPLAEAERRLGNAADQVEALLHRGLQSAHTPGDAAALACALAACLVQRRAHAAAREALHTAEPLLAETPPLLRAGLHFQLGELYRTLDDLDAARRHFACSADLDPQGPHAAAAWRAART